MKTSGEKSGGNKRRREMKGKLFMIYRRCEFCTNTKMFQTGMGQLKCTRCKHIYLK
jgi:hypothetical protein